MDEDEFYNAEVRQLLQNAERRLRKRGTAEDLINSQSTAGSHIIASATQRHNLTGVL